MQARGIVGYGEFVAANLWSSDEMRSGVRENLRHRREVAISEALHQEQEKAASLLKQANVMAKKTREAASKAGKQPQAVVRPGTHITAQSVIKEKGSK